MKHALLTLLLGIVLVQNAIAAGPPLPCGNVGLGGPGGPPPCDPSTTCCIQGPGSPPPPPLRPPSFPPGPNQGPGGPPPYPYAANGLAAPTGAGKAGVNSFNAYTGNGYREVTDFSLHAGAGEHVLTWQRIHNTRFINAELPFGQGGNWRHNYQWEMVDTTTGERNPGDSLTVYYPNGKAFEFVRLESNTNEWRSYALCKEYLVATTNGLIEMRTSEGWRYQFATLTNAEEAVFFQMQQFYDSQQNLYSLSYNTNNQLVSVSEPAGRSLQVNWATNRITSVTNGAGLGVTYTYQLFDAQNPDSEMVLSAVNYAGGVQATYTYIRQYEDTPPNLSVANDPHYSGAGAYIKYVYVDNFNSEANESAVGFLLAEAHPITELNYLTLVASHMSRPIINPDDSVMIIRYNFGQATSAYLSDDDFISTLTYSTYGFSESGAGYLTNSVTGAGEGSANQTNYYTNSHLGNWVARTHPDGSTEYWGRDNLDLVLAHTNQLGRITLWTRDTNTHCVTRIDYPDTSYETFAYNSFGQVTQHRLKSGGTNSYAYTTNGLCTHLTNALGYVTAYTYDAYDRLASVIDARGYTNGYTYDARGYLVKVTQADGSWSGSGYDNYGNRTKQTNELGAVWTWNYNELSQMTNSVDPLGRTTTYSYTFGQGGCCGGGGSGMSSVPTMIVTPSGRTNVFEYDAAGRKVAEIVAYGTAEAATNRFEYDAVGNLTNRIDALGNSWKTYFNALNQPIAAVDPLDRTNSWTYDALGNKLSETRADGTTTTFGYDSMNRLIATTNALGHVVTYGYDVLGNLIQLVDTKGNTNQWAYGLLGHRLSKTYADSTQDRYAYDAVGNLAYFTNAASEVQTITYDSRNRPTLKAWNSNGDTEAMTYDAAGRLTVLTNSVSVITNAYDDANQLTAEGTTLSGQSTRTVSYTYNSDGQRKSMTYPNGLVLTNDYTARGQLASLTFDGPPPLATYAYDLAGQRTMRVYENGVNAYYTNDAAGQLLALAHVKTNGGSVIVQVNHDYDLVGNRTNRIESFTGYSSATDSYGYDSTDQLTSVSYSGGARTASFGYDPMGNLTNKLDTGTGTNTYTANNLNQLSTLNAQALNYDLKGNLTNRPGWLYSWNAKNQLTIAEPASPTNGAIKITFAYDARHRCVKRQSWAWSTNTLNYQLSSSQHLVYSGWSLIEERDAGTNVVSYANGPSIDEVIAKFTSTNTVFYHGDAQHSTLALTDASANILERYRYEAFGLPSIYDSTFSPLSSSLYGVRHFFQGREWLADVKLNDHRYRHYAPELQRWISRDLVGELDSNNLYLFVHNNPILFSDEFGLTSSSAGYSQCMQAAQQAFSTCISMPVNCANQFVNWFPNWVQVAARLRNALLAPCRAGGLITGIACAAIITHFVLKPALQIIGQGLLIGGAGVAGYAAGCGISFVSSAQNCAYVHYGINPTPMN